MFAICGTVECIWPSFHFQEQLYAEATLVLSLFILLSVMWRLVMYTDDELIEHVTVPGERKRRASIALSYNYKNTVPSNTVSVSVSAKITNVILRLLSLLYISVSRSAFQTFNCVAQPSLLSVDIDLAKTTNLVSVSYIAGILNNSYI